MRRTQPSRQSVHSQPLRRVRIHAAVYLPIFVCAKDVPLLRALCVPASSTDCGARDPAQPRTMRTRPDRETDGATVSPVLARPRLRVVRVRNAAFARIPFDAAIRPAAGRISHASPRGGTLAPAPRLSCPVLLSPLARDCVPSFSPATLPDSSRLVLPADGRSHSPQVLRGNPVEPAAVPRITARTRRDPTHRPPRQPLSAAPQWSPAYSSSPGRRAHNNREKCARRSPRSSSAGGVPQGALQALLRPTLLVFAPARDVTGIY